MTIYVNLSVELEQAVRDTAARWGCTVDQLANAAVARWLRDKGEDIPLEKCNFPPGVQS